MIISDIILTVENNKIHAHKVNKFLITLYKILDNPLYT